MAGQTKQNKSVEESVNFGGNPVRVWDQDDQSWLAHLGRLTEWLGRKPVTRGILNATPGLMAVLDGESKVAACNDRFAQQAGVTEEQARGKRLGHLLGCQHAQGPTGECGASALCQSCDLNQALQTVREGIPSSASCYLLSGQGATLKSHEFQATVRPLPEAGQGWSVCALDDISDQRRRHLLERVFFHDLLNRVMALESVTLAAVDCQATLVEQREAIEMAQVISRSLREEVQTQQILMMAEDGSLVPRFTAVDSGDLLRQEAEVVRHLDCAWGKRVEVDLAARSRIETDPILLARVLLNLLKNALEASPQDSAVHCAVTVRDGATVFWVENEGVIPDQVLRNLFHRSFSTKGTGRGVGLYSVKLLTEKFLSGKVGLFADGAKVRFEVTLPALAAQAA